MLPLVAHPEISQVKFIGHRILDEELGALWKKSRDINGVFVGVVPSAPELMDRISCIFCRRAGYFVAG